MEFILWLGFYFLTVYALLPAFVSRMFGFRVFNRGKTEKEISITFDDGPDPVYTPQLLDLLKRYGARCTFFLVGAHAEQHPEIVARIHKEGHVIGIHNYQHYTNWLMRPKTVRKHILRTSDVINRITGIRPVYYRPPWGIVNLFDFRRLGHLQIVLWTGMFGDWKAKVGAEKLYLRMRRKLRPGEVFVLHDSGRTFGADEEAPAQMISALERILEDGRQKGYRFVGVDDMIALTEKNKPRKIGWFKKIIVSIWMLWEKAFHAVFRLKPVGDGTKYHYRIRKYSGPTIEMRDGKSLRGGDYVFELHFDNQMLYNIGMKSRTSVQIAIRLIRDMESGLPDMARILETAPNGDKVAALYGVTMIHQGGGALGFQAFDLPKGFFARLTNRYLKFMLSVIHPEGGKRVKEHGELSPKIILMERSDLMAWKGRTGRERPSRAARRESKEPAAGASSGIPADQVGV